MEKCKVQWNHWPGFLWDQIFCNLLRVSHYRQFCAIMLISDQSSVKNPTTVKMSTFSSVTDSATLCNAASGNTRSSLITKSHAAWWIFIIRCYEERSILNEKCFICLGNIESIEDCSFFASRKRNENCELVPCVGDFSTGEKAHI